MRCAAGQVLVLFALVLPLLLLPVAAYVVDFSVVASRHASLQAATAEVAEIVAQRIDVATLRAVGTLQVDPRDASSEVAALLAIEEPTARVESVALNGATLTVVSDEPVDLPVAVFARSTVTTARATARIVPGYSSPSSFWPLATRTF